MDGNAAGATQGWILIGLGATIFMPFLQAVFFQESRVIKAQWLLWTLGIGRVTLMAGGSAFLLHKWIAALIGASGAIWVAYFLSAKVRGVLNAMTRIRLTLKPQDTFRRSIGAHPPIIPQRSTTGDEHLGRVFRELVQRDRESPHRLFRITPEQIEWSKANLQSGAYLDFIFKVYSSSVHRVRFDQQPTGGLVRYLKEGKEIGEIIDSPRLSHIDDILHGLERSFEGKFTIRQYLRPEMQKLLISCQSQEVGFHFDNVRLPVTTKVTNSAGGLDIGPTWELPLPSFKKALVPVSIAASPESD